jgi:hypothetical protein
MFVRTPEVALDPPIVLSAWRMAVDLHERLAERARLARSFEVADL